ncbi:MAG: hypothetical protein J4F33_09135 [Alphaproteobacteria bacterium]|nr:hypothetical protein [Alphaproteobacteria bacterium]
MRTIRRTAAFKRDYKREKKGRFANTLDAQLGGIVADLVLIYRKPDAAYLDLVRLGSHGELGL